jgi:hypothetical protein
MVTNLNPKQTLKYENPEFPYQIIIPSHNIKN